MKTKFGQFRTLILFSCLFYCMFSTGSTLGNVWYVNGELPVSGSGTSWLEAVRSVQEAVDAASAGDEVWVKMGNYPINSTIEVNKSIRIYGGFAGGETQRSQRSWKTNVTTIDGQGTRATSCFDVNGDVRIDGFAVTRGTGSFSAAGIKNGPSSILRLDNCTIIENSGYWGGGMSNHGKAMVTNCTFIRNLADNGVGIDNYGSLIVRDSSFIENSGDGTGGGIENFGSMIVQNSIFSRNHTYGWGAGVINYGNGVITNSTFYRNVATKAGGAISSYRGSLTVTNSILWGDSAPIGPEIDDASASVVVAYSDIQGGYPGKGNMNADPLFADPANDDFHLQGGSPAINAGTARAPKLPHTDFEGDPRIVGARPDMGADEFVTHISIDIKPRSYPNRIDLSDKGVVPVAILSTVDFDASSTVDPNTVVFAGASPVRWALKDMDGDGDIDLLFYFQTQSLNLTKNSTDATLVGKTYGGIDFLGKDTVKIVP